MADLKQELEAHKAREQRATNNIEKLSSLLRHNVAVRNAERVRASRVAARLAKRSDTRGRRAVRRALSRVGVHEVPAASNSGPFISNWIRTWC